MFFSTNKIDGSGFLESLCFAGFLFVLIGGDIAGAAVLQPKGSQGADIMEAIRMAAPGDVVQLKEGKYELSETLNLKSGIQMLGAGAEKTILTYAGQKSAPFLRINGCQDVEVAHLALDGQMKVLGQDGIQAGNSQRLYLHHLAIRNLAKGNSGFTHGIIFSGNNPTMERGVTDSIISDCLLEKIGQGVEYGGGIRMAWGSSRNRVIRNTIRETGRGGIFGDHSSDLLISSNRVSGSGGEGLGIEIWGGCPRSLIEDNEVDHWISNDQGNLSAMRRNVVGTEDGTLKGYGIEVIARDVVVTDNLVKKGAAIGLSVSNKPRKNNVFWGYNTIRDCIQWGTQLQGETGGIARHYFYQCVFEKSVYGDARARYPKDSGHGFRFNGSTREQVFEDCLFRDNGGCGVQFVGKDVDLISFVHCQFTNNTHGVATGLSSNKTVEFTECRNNGQAWESSIARKFTSAPPIAAFQMPVKAVVGTGVRFECQSKPGSGEIVERLWDFGQGIPATNSVPSHVYAQPGKYRVTLIVWDAGGRGDRKEQWLEVTAR